MGTAAPDHPDWLPAGMDPKTSYFLEIHIKANHRTCRPETSCYKFSKVQDSDVCNFMDFVREIVDKCPHGYQELVHVFYYDDVTKGSSQVTSDQELLEMFSKHADRKVVHITITYTEPRDMPIPCMCFHPKISEVLDIPCTPSIACPSIAAASQSSQPLFSQHTNPTTSQPRTSQQPAEPSYAVDHDPDDESDDDPDDDGYLANPEPHNEHVGVDDEELYLPAPAPKTHVGGDDVGEQSKSESESDPESNSESDVEYEEEDGLIGADPLPPMPNVAYDRDDPPMSVGSLYPNIAQFRLALSQHAIKNEFEYMCSTK
ncbi:unnamed protein product [Urochloa decumbens]|uniref:PB1 domain-containing protein n=1 Tax=Urochloa decumbens TaxID=240449 RepID=A0ABC9ANN9_9POAL